MAYPLLDGPFSLLIFTFPDIKFADVQSGHIRNTCPLVRERTRKREHTPLLWDTVRYGQKSLYYTGTLKLDPRMAFHA